MIRLPKVRAGDQRGVAAIELALIAPVFMLVVVGIVDISNAYSGKLALEQGAQRAIEKIMQTTEDDTVEGTLKSEAVCQVNGLNANGTCKTAPLTASNVVVTWRLECINRTSRVIATTRTSTDPDAFDLMTCTAAERDARYIEVRVTNKYTPMFPIHFAKINSDKTYHLSATAGMRTQ